MNDMLYYHSNIKLTVNDDHGYDYCLLSNDYSKDQSNPAYSSKIQMFLDSHGLEYKISKGFSHTINTKTVFLVPKEVVNYVKLIGKVNDTGMYPYKTKLYLIFITLKQ